MFEFDSEKEDHKSTALKTWIRTRVEAIHQRLDAETVLRNNGVRLRYSGAQPEQISCPFHGTDRKPSARYHPASGKGPSGVWCFVCNERWDAITLWGKFAQHEGTFTSLLRRIEKELGLETPEPPLVANEPLPPDDRLLVQLQSVEARLTASKRSFNLDTYLKVGSVLDHLWYDLERGALTFEKAQPVIRAVLEKIRVQCRDG